MCSPDSAWWPPPNNRYRFGTQMWATGIRSQKHHGNQELRPLPYNPVLELPEELQAVETDDDERAGGGISQDEYDARRVGGCPRNWKLKKSMTMNVLVVNPICPLLALQIHKKTMTRPGPRYAAPPTGPGNDRHTCGQ
ncbi:hypothetical protein FN846DRAFT_893452 [Sphaerosporella brunnea]|uniref:Uncharacterized protein n=1 Tax=Sphaerosporella brunnea TaxID=1250544 RepID=A0A5J5EME7_9PEZI|nr:hypothetical protein FN846DRAFT_893452 [Sphaerosporella brunnea]